MIFNSKPMKLTSDDSLTNHMQNSMNEFLNEQRLRSYNLTNVTFTRYNGRLKYAPEVLKKSKEAGILSINLNTQFQTDEIEMIKYTPEAVNIGVEGRTFVFQNLNIYQPTGFGEVLTIYGLQLAEYFPEVNHMNLLFDFEEFYSQIKSQVSSSSKEYASIFFKNLIRLALASFAAKKRMVDFEDKNWLNEAKRELNIANLKEKTIRLYKEKVKELDSQISSDIYKIEDLKSNIVSTIRRLATNETTKASMQNGDESLVTKMIQEMDSILNNVYINKVAYSGDSFEFLTNYLPIYDDKQVWEGNCYFVSVNMSTASVKIESIDGKGFKGHWSANDCHPHVSGEGKPCLGSINTAISENVARHELYVLTVILVEYLKSVNKSDSAGQRITESGRRKLTKEEVKVLMAYENEEEAVEEIALPIEMIVTTKKTRKAPTIADEILASAPQAVQPIPVVETNAIDVTSECVVCGVDVYAHGAYQPVVDVRNGEEIYKVACNACVKSENGFTGGHVSGLTAYNGIIGGTF